MRKNIGASSAGFILNGTSWSLDIFEDTVPSITFTDKYHIVYDGNDSEEMSEREFAHFSLPPNAHGKAQIARHVLGASMVERVVVVQMC